MKPTHLWSATALALVACSQGTGGESSTIGPEPSDSTASTSASGLGGGPGELSYQTADRFMFFLPGEYDSSLQTEGDPAFVAKHLWACRIDAPELGERVAYLERSDLDNVDSPYFQLVVAIDAVSSDYDRAVAKLYAPDDLAPWIGLCQGGEGQAMPTGVQELVGCDTPVSDDHTGSFRMSISGAASCFPNAPEGSQGGYAFFAVDGAGCSWRDDFSLADGTIVRDPPLGDYRLDRHTVEAP